MTAAENAAYAVEHDPVRLELERIDRHVYRELHKALCLAPDLETFETALAGDIVPLDRYDLAELRLRGRRR